TGRDLDDIAAKKDRVWNAKAKSNGKPAPRPARPTKTPRRAPKADATSKKSGLPPSIEVQLATLAKEAPEGDEWIHEIKFDGYRMICRVAKGRAAFISRNQQD